MPLSYNPLADLRSADRETVLAALDLPTQRVLNARFAFWALNGQEPPGATARPTPPARCNIMLKP